MVDDEVVGETEQLGYCLDFNVIFLLVSFPFFSFFKYDCYECRINEVIYAV